MIGSAQLMQILMANTIGLSILVETLRSAAHFAVSPPSYENNHDWVVRSYYKEGKECYAFVQGTGLETLLVNYNLQYDADKLREGFNYYVRKSA